jgi:hypothetical protein
VTPEALAVPLFLAAGLLVAAGVAKLLRPRPTAQAMVDAGLPGNDAAARSVGVVEVAVGGWALVTGSVTAALALGALYLVFAGFLAYVVRTHPDAGSCGCAGGTAVPPSLLHLTLNLLAALAGLAAAASGGVGGLADWVSSLGWGTVPAGLGIVLAGWLAVVAVTEVPGAFRAWVPPVHADEHIHGPRDHHDEADHALVAAGIGPGHASLWPGPDDPMNGGSA